MDTLPQEMLGLTVVVFLLGLKHGMDPDHLATIDGLARFNVRTKPRLSRWSGFLFSLGHGVVVTAVAAAVALAAQQWSAPDWLEDVGAWISILFLLGLGGANLRAVFQAPCGEVVRPVGLKGRLLGRLGEASHPVVIAFVGAAFALSFDTLSQAALFSLTASSLAGWLYSAALGIVFMLGMMVTDGVNGLWIARLLRAADRRALIVSRVMGLVIAFLSLGIALLGIAKYFVPTVATLVEGAGFAMGAALAAMLIVSFKLAIRLSKPA